MSIKNSNKDKYDLSPKTCKICNKNIPYIRRYLKFCSDDCKVESKKSIEKIENNSKKCLNCDKQIFSRGWTKQRFERTKCCSRSCLYEWFKKTSPDKKERELRACKFCKNQFETIKNSTRKKIYCSNECFRKGHKGSFKLTEEHKKRISETRLRDWASGEVYKEQDNFFCKWYEFTKKNGEVIKVQGTWELKYAQWMDNNNINFITHKGCMYYKDKSGKDRVYLPDFYLPDTDEYIDVKSKYTYSLHQDKFECIVEHNPDKKIKLLFEEDLKQLGILL